jgi:hypothetical protein
VACYKRHLERTKPAPAPERTPEEQLAADRAERTRRDELTVLRTKYTQALQTIESQAQSLAVLDNFVTKGIDTFEITPKQPTGTSESTVVLVASDWHMEEIVNKAMVSGLNEHSVDIASARATKFFRTGLRLTQLLQKDTRIDNMILPLLGDFISNDIHEEFPETNELLPMQAIELAETTIASGIEFLLANSDLNLTIPCHSGNHARTTRTTRFGAENGHSLEYIMYRHLARYFALKAPERVTFIIPEGPHSYLKIYDQTLRFHHGHMIKYQGGIGGIFIPAYKAIAQWNKARHADLDVFGHFHQRKDGGNFVSNGSNIGYNPFALSIKADFEPPSQQLFMINKRYGRTCTWPVLVG